MFDTILQWFGQSGDLGTWGAQLAKIIWINILLSGDNAVVIALACRGLAPKQRMWGIILGAAVAIILRIGFTVVATQLLQYKWLMAVGSLLLFWIAVKLLTEDGEEKDITQSTSILGAVQTIAIADLVMSLDNVVAIAAAAKGDWSLILIGLLTSMPMIIFGATFFLWILQRAPVLVWAGAALLGWVAAELFISDPGVVDTLRHYTDLPVVRADGVAGAYEVASWVKYAAATLGAAIVVVLGALLRPPKAHASA